jgi:hypothetical protein
MTVEKQMDCGLAGETEVLRENLPRRHFRPSQNPTTPDPGLNPGRRGGKPATNGLSYGAAQKTPFQIVPIFCMRIRCRGNVFTEFAYLAIDV